MFARAAAAVILPAMMIAYHLPKPPASVEPIQPYREEHAEERRMYDAPLLVSGPELALYDDELRTITPSEPEPAPAPYIYQGVHAANAIAGMPEALGRCREHPDRFNWQKYVQAYDWPLEEVAYVIHAESRGDLCAVNRSSGAACWFQILSAEQYLPGYLDPESCVAAAYRKWLDGGRSFERHWYRWWG